MRSNFKIAPASCLDGMWELGNFRGLVSARFGGKLGKCVVEPSVAG